MPLDASSCRFRKTHQYEPSAKASASTWLGGRTSSPQGRTMTGEVPVVDETAHLLAWVKGRDVPCPVCGYNLRDLTRPVCPECRHDVHLTVGVLHPRLGWLFVALTPSMFSAVAAGLLLVPMTMMLLVGGEPAPWPVVGAEVFGWVSAMAGLVLFLKRNLFLRLPAPIQGGWAVGIWVVHLLAFAGFVLALSLI